MKESYHRLANIAAGAWIATMILLLVMLGPMLQSPPEGWNIADSVPHSTVAIAHALSAMLAAFFLARSRGRGIFFSAFLSLGLHFGVFVAYGLEDRATS